jgi:hypothetical protein
MSMKLPWLAAFALACLAMWLGAATPQRAPGWVHEYPTPTTREEAAVTVNGVEEIWALRWKSAPKPECAEYYMAITCPCNGFAYGEAGELELVRMRERVVIDRLDLTPLIAGAPEGTGPVLPRWPKQDKDSDDTAGPEIRRRAVVQVMHFADFDHDGQPSEFLLTTGTVSCGHTYGMVVGISRANPRLHVFGTASQPDTPLFLQRGEWETLRKAVGPLEMVDWACEDHGSDTETVVRLQWTAAGIDGRRRHYSCGEKGRDKLISEEPL